jgi:DNA-directed RNA polymerase subunit K/omega
VAEPTNNQKNHEINQSHNFLKEFSVPIKPANLEDIYTNVENLYEAIAVASKRSRQIHDELKIELNQRLETIKQLTATPEADEDLEVVTSNPDQLKISLEFETRDKPTDTAVKELFAKRLEYRYKEPAPKLEVTEE